MIAALFALAAAMVIGGCAAVIQGFPYVRLESGLAMVIAGSVAASSGAVLFGLGVLGVVFRRVERAIGQNAAPGQMLAPVQIPVLGTASAGPVAEGRPRLPPVLPAAPAFIVPPVVEPPYDPDRSRIEPSLDLREEAARAEATADARRQAGAEPDLSILVPVPAPIPEPPHTVGLAPEDDLFAVPEPPPATLDEAPPLRSSLDAAADPEPAPKVDSQGDPEADSKPAARTVVGRYASGGNTYVMFEDGSIEAETPQGRFTFASLDELKAFVDGGGESGSRGAA